MPPLELAPVVQDAIRALEPDVLISNVGGMEDVLQQTVADRGFPSWLLDGFSSTALDGRGGHACVARPGLSAAAIDPLRALRDD